MSENGPGRIDAAYPAQLLEYVLIGLLLESPFLVILASRQPVAAEPEGSLPVVALVALVVAFAYAFGLVSYSITFRFFQFGVERGTRTRVVEKHCEVLRPHEDKIRRLGATLPDPDNGTTGKAWYRRLIPRRLSASESKHMEVCYTVIAMIHPYVSHRSKAAAEELMYHRRLFRMARGAALPALLWLLLSSYWLGELRWQRVGFWSAPDFLTRSDAAVGLFIAASILFVGVIVTTQIQTEQFARFTVRYFLALMQEEEDARPKHVQFDFDSLAGSLER